MKKNEKKETAKRILGRRLAQEVSSEDMKKASGGCTVSYAAGHPGDIDQDDNMV